MKKPAFLPTLFSKGIRLSLMTVLLSAGGGLAASSEWTGAIDSGFTNPGNWNGPVPGSTDSAYFLNAADVEFTQSGRVSALYAYGPLSFHLNGRTFRTSETSIGGDSALFVSGGIASLGYLNLNGSLLATGAGTLVTTSSWDGSGRLVQVTEGAALQANVISSGQSNFVVQIASGGAISAESVSIGNGQALSVTGIGSLLSSGSVDISGLATVADGGSLSADSLGLSGLLAVSGPGSSVSVTNFSAGSTGSISVTSGGAAVLGGSDGSSPSIQSITVAGIGSQITSSRAFRAQSVSVGNAGTLSLQNRLDVDGGLVVSGGHLSSTSLVYVKSLLEVKDGGTLQAPSLVFSQDGGRITASGTGTTVSAGPISANNFADRLHLSVTDGAVVGITYMTRPLASLSITGTGAAVSIGSYFEVEGTTSIADGATLTVKDFLGLRGTSSIRNATVTTARLNNDGILDIRSSTLGYGIQTQNSGTLYNNGTGVLTGSFSTNFHLRNSGVVRVAANESMSFQGADNFGSISVDHGTLEFTRAAFLNTGSIVLAGDLRAENGFRNEGALETSGTANLSGGDFTNTSNGSVAILTSSTMNFMDDVINDGVIAVGLDSTAVFYGSYSGGGIIAGPGTTIMLGDLRPGHSPGQLEVQGDLVFGENFVYDVEIGAANEGGYDQVKVAGLISIDGVIRFTLIDGFRVELGQTFEIVTFGAREGDFKGYDGLVLENGFALRPEWTESALLLTVVPEPSLFHLLGIGAIFLLWRRFPAWRKTA